MTESIALQKNSSNQRIPIEDEFNLAEALLSPQRISVRRRIFRQLIESLIYEGVMKPEVDCQGNSCMFRFHGYNPNGLPVTYSCRGKKRFSFGRIRLNDEPVLRIQGESSVEALSFADFMLEVNGNTSMNRTRLLHFIHELEQTLDKDTLAQVFIAKEKILPRSYSYDELESRIIDGHPYHPSYKSRVGFNCKDNLAFGPEFRPALYPLWLAAHKEQVQQSQSRHLNNEHFIRSEIGDHAYDQFADQILQRTNKFDDYVLLPVHPWQWREHIAVHFQQDLNNGNLIFLGPTNDEYRPQQSIRTLANVTDSNKAYLKLSLSIINTSTSRILAPHTVQNAPLISDWLHELVQLDPYLKEELRSVFLREVMGVAYSGQRSELLSENAYGALSCIWRESLHPYLEQGEQAIPFQGLCHLSQSGLPYINSWIDDIGLITWLSKLLEVSVLPVVHMLYAHGIALESHAQNMVLIHRQGMPQRVAFKDFHDGIRFTSRYLGSPQARPSLNETPAYHVRINQNSFIETDSVERVRDFMHDAFFFINLSELAMFLADRFDFDERHFWGMVRAVIESYQRRFSHLQERFALFDVFAECIEVEQLTKRRLFPDTELRVHRVPNPLAQKN